MLTGILHSVRIMFIIVILTLLVIAPVVPPALAQGKIDKAVPLTDLMLTDLDAYINGALKRFNVPGAAVAIVQNGKVIYAKGLGVRDLSTNAPVTADTLFMTASITKSMTTMMIAKLVDNGILTWDTPVTDILPTFKLSDPASTSIMRVRDLMNNASGVARHDFPLLLKAYSPEQVIESLALIPVVGKPGEKYNYSNQMVATGGFIAAIAAGAKYGENVYDTYKQLMQKRVFVPIGMIHTTFDFDSASVEKNLAIPYTWDTATGKLMVVPFSSLRAVITTAPAGGTWSTIQDLGLYLATQLNDGIALNGTRVVSEKNLLETRKPGVQVEPGVHYGMGWEITQYNGLELVRHTGASGGFSTEIAFLPEANLGIVVLTNGFVQPFFMGAVREYVFELAFGGQHEADAKFIQIQGQISGLLAKAQGAVDSAIDSKAVAEYLGDYEYGVKVRLDSNGRLVYSSEFGEGQLLAVHGVPGTFITRGAPFSFAGGVQFAKNTQGVVTMTLSVAIGDIPPLVLAKTS
jgi:CubicO group peptidase (beta-lactamase class C family)